MSGEENKGEKEEMNKGQEKDVTEKLRGNPWILSTFVLSIFVIVLLVGSLGAFSLTGNAVSSDEAGAKFITLASLQLNNIEIIGIQKENGLYRINFTSDETGESSVYLTLDGSYLITGLIPLSTSSDSNTSDSSTASQTEVPKADKPKAELYIWSYCPYGVTALGPFSEVASLLKNSADFKVHLYYAGHGDFELQQNKIQACIQDLGYKSYWNYAKTFADKIYKKCSGNIDCDLNESVALMKSLGIDSNKVLSCVKSNGDALLKEDSNAAASAGVTGSPTLIINGVKVNADRTADAYKTAVCSAFTNAPQECGQALNTTGTTASGNCG